MPWPHLAPYLEPNLSYRGLLTGWGAGRPRAQPAAAAVKSVTGALWALQHHAWVDTALMHLTGAQRRPRVPGL